MRHHRAIADHFDDNFFAHGHTYEAHPLTLAPAIAAIDEYKRLGLIDRSRQMGEMLGAEARARSRRSTRRSATCAACGLFWAVDLVKDRTTKEPFNTHAGQGWRGKPLVIDQVTGEMIAARRRRARLGQPPRDRAAAHHHRGRARRGRAPRSTRRSPSPTPPSLTRHRPPMRPGR